MQMFLPELRVSLYMTLIYINPVFLSPSFHPHPLTHTHTSQTSSANQEADSNWPKGFHPAQTADYSCALGSCRSSPAGQDNHHPAPADHCAACGQTFSGQHPTSAPSRSELTLQHIETHCLTSHCIASDQCTGYMRKQCAVLYLEYFCN